MTAREKLWGWIQRFRKQYADKGEPVPSVSRSYDVIKASCPEGAALVAEAGREHADLRRREQDLSNPGRGILSRMRKYSKDQPRVEALRRAKNGDPRSYAFYDLRLDRPEKQEALSRQIAGDEFLDEVRRYSKENPEATKLQAQQAVARENPELSRRYSGDRRAKRTGSGDGDAEAKFMELAHRIRDERDVPLADAYKIAARENPEAYHAYDLAARAS